MSENINFLFIAGAPRSGTTLLSNLFDGHPEILMFPTEHSTLEHFFWNRDNMENYARTTFVNERTGGQQTFLTNRAAYERNQKHLQEQYGKSAPMAIAPEVFKKAYLSYLDGKTASLENILLALASGLTKSNNFASQRTLAQRQYAAYKQPFYTELFAQETFQQLGNCKFIHILRDPISRYTSAKTRRIKQFDLQGRKLSPINRMSYVTGHTFIDLASRHLAEENLSVLGDDVYRTVNFEELARAPEKTMFSVLEWLNVKQEGFQVLPTRYGEPVDSGSSLSTGFKVDSTSTERSEAYHSITSAKERLIHSSLLNGVQNQRVSRLVPAFLSPLPNSSWKNYICQIIDLSKWLVKKSPPTPKQFITMVKQKRCAVSGTT